MDSDVLVLQMKTVSPVEENRKWNSLTQIQMKRKAEQGDPGTYSCAIMEHMYNYYYYNPVITLTCMFCNVHNCWSKGC